ncbi:MAG: hypothetical protein RDV41_11120, partial [Planctomycetota bacterium]|nr:hypothetical protein [Planctomycetota bacterium]
DILVALAKTRIRFLVFGGFAEVLVGAPIQTVDLDILIRRDTVGAEKALGALRQLGFQPVDNNGNALRIETGRDVILFSQLRFVRRGSPAVDVFMKPPVATFDALWGRRRRLALGNRSLALFSIGDLLAARRKFLRTKDIARLAYLEDLARDMKRRGRR